MCVCVCVCVCVKHDVGGGKEDSVNGISETGGPGPDWVREHLDDGASIFSIVDRASEFYVGRDAFIGRRHLPMHPEQQQQSRWYYDSEASNGNGRHIAASHKHGNLQPRPGAGVAILRCWIHAGTIRASVHASVHPGSNSTHHCIQSPSMMPSSLTSDR